MIILGIDPGTTIIGYAVIEVSRTAHVLEADLIHVTSKLPHERIRELHVGLRDLITRSKPAAISVEKIFFAKNVKTAVSVAESRGIILLTAALAELSIYEYTPLEIKQTVTGDGNADKSQVEKMLRMTMPEICDIQARDDVFDAIAVALTCYYRAFKPSTFQV